jgi:molybdopterin/thiamine biosynthesis adenylyltransferase
MNRNERGSLTEEQKTRYRRQLAIPEIGSEGQIRLGKARVLIVGLGGLGSVSSYYLAAAGVGCLRIVDHDTVCLDNLNRQLLHSTPDLDRPKTESATEKLRRLNPECFVEPVRVRVGEDTGFELTEGCDLILDATDNLATRHVLNRISLARRIPLIYGGINGWNGSASTFVPGETGCLSCLFPSKDLGTPATGFPVVGPAAGVIGSIQSVEAIRILLGMSPALANRLLNFQGKGMKFRTVHVGKDPACPQCGPSTGE